MDDRYPCAICMLENYCLEIKIEVRIENIEQNIEKLVSQHQSIFDVLVGTADLPPVKGSRPLTLTEYSDNRSMRLRCTSMTEEDLHLRICSDQANSQRELWMSETLPQHHVR